MKYLILLSAFIAFILAVSAFSEQEKSAELQNLSNDIIDGIDVGFIFFIEIFQKILNFSRNKT